jgi:hypothetical protein
MEKYDSTRVNEMLTIKPGTWFVADIIGNGIYEMVKNGINHTGNVFAIVKLKKLFCEGWKYVGHETTCHPIDIARWDKFKILKKENKMA